MKKILRRIALKMLSPKSVDFLGNQYSISNGPFIGMKYIKESTGSSFAPKVLGTYEKELQHTNLIQIGNLVKTHMMKF